MTYVLKNTVCRSYRVTPEGDHVLVLEPAEGPTIDRHPRPGDYEAFRRLRKRLPASAVMIEDLDPEAVHHPSGTLRTTVVLEDRSGASLFLSPDDVPKVLEAVEQSLRPLQIDLEDLILAEINSRESRIAAMLALYFVWHDVGAEGVEAVLEKHRRACITFAIDRRLNGTAFHVSAEYEDLFDYLSSTQLSLLQPARGTA